MSIQPFYYDPMFRKPAITPSRRPYELVCRRCKADFLSPSYNTRFCSAECLRLAKEEKSSGGAAK